MNAGSILLNERRPGDNTIYPAIKLCFTCCQRDISRWILKVVLYPPAAAHDGPIISHINYWDQVNSWKNFWKFLIGTLCRNKSGPSPYSMLQYLGRVTTPKLVPRNCLRYLQTTLIMRVGGLVSEFMWGIVLSENINEK